MQIFVTGCTGLLGSNFVRQAAGEGHRVFGLARTARKFQYLLGDTNASCVLGDLRDLSAFADVLESCDAVVHTAAYLREYYAPGDHEEELRAVNVDATLRLLHCADAAGVKAFLHVGSSGTIGTKRDGSPGDEQTPPDEDQLRNAYYRSKFETDRAIAAFEPAHVKVMEVIPGWMWGPRDAGPTGAAELALRIMERTIPAVPAGGKCTVDARDVAAGMLRMLARPSHRERTIVAGRYLRLREVVGAVADAAGVEPPPTIPVSLALAAGHLIETWSRLVGREPKASVEGIRAIALDKQVSSAKAEAELGVEFRPFADTARDTVSWLRDHYAPGRQLRSEKVGAPGAV